MHLCIIEADQPDPALQDRFPSYAALFERWLRPALPEARFSSVDVSQGHRLPDPAGIDGALLAGSRHGVYEDHPWLDLYRAFLLEMKQLGKPVGGVCFGHQIMAQSYGGAVAKSARGWQIGRGAHAVTDHGRALIGDHDGITALSFHQDQVVTPPPGARVILENDRSPVGGLRYDFPALSVQFHPEFETAYVAALLDRFEGVRLPESVVCAGREGLEGPLDNDVIAETFAGFYRRHHRP